MRSNTAAPAASVRIAGRDVSVNFSLSTIARIETAMGCTPVAFIRSIAAESGDVPDGLDKDAMNTWLRSDEGRRSMAKAAENVSAVRMLRFIAACLGEPESSISEKLPLDGAYATYLELQTAFVDATRQMMRSDEEDDQDPPSAG